MAFGHWPSSSTTTPAPEVCGCGCTVSFWQAQSRRWSWFQSLIKRQADKENKRHFRPNGTFPTRALAKLPQGLLGASPAARQCTPSLPGDGWLLGPTSQQWSQFGKRQRKVTQPEFSWHTNPSLGTFRVVDSCIEADNPFPEARAGFGPRGPSDHILMLCYEIHASYLMGRNESTF